MLDGMKCKFLPVDRVTDGVSIRSKIMIDISLKSTTGVKLPVVLIPQQRIDGHGESL